MTTPPATFFKFSILMILGDGIVHKAIAQTVGSRFAPVTFSFGCVAYDA